jgi:hypothetical protein
MKRDIKQQLTFEQKGTWSALNAAMAELKKQGYDYGSMDYPNPIAVVYGDYQNHVLNLPEKWHNFKPVQKNAIDGKLTGNFREGPVTLIIYHSLFNYKKPL